MNIQDLQTEKIKLLGEERFLEGRLRELKLEIEVVSNLITAAGEYKKFRSKERSPIYDFAGKKWKSREFITNALKVLNGKGTKEQIKSVMVNSFELSRTKAENICKKNLSIMVDEKKLRYDGHGYILSLIS